MDNLEQTQAFSDTLDAAIDRFTQEFDLSYASVIGVLAMKAIEITIQSSINYEDDDETSS
ncbi:MAG: hypothetical protein ACO3FO_06395 [Candidatus Nanopelagicaceae bacterium]|jgi:hypothetical protein